MYRCHIKVPVTGHPRQTESPVQVGRRAVPGAQREGPHVRGPARPTGPRRGLRFPAIVCAVRQGAQRKQHLCGTTFTAPGRSHTSITG